MLEKDKKFSLFLRSVILFMVEFLCVDFVYSIIGLYFLEFNTDCKPLREKVYKPFLLR